MDVGSELKSKTTTTSRLTSSFEQRLDLLLWTWHKPVALLGKIVYLFLPGFYYPFITWNSDKALFYEQTNDIKFLLLTLLQAYLNCPWLPSLDIISL